jgi:hypothetical protein
VDSKAGKMQDTGDSILCSWIKENRGKGRIYSLTPHCEKAYHVSQGAKSFGLEHYKPQSSRAFAAFWYQPGPFHLALKSRGG